jgi:hypothetical protein
MVGFDGILGQVFWISANDCSWEMVSFVARPAIDGFVPLRLISLPIIEVPNGHEQMSEVGKRLTTAECRLVGLADPDRSTVFRGAGLS